MIHFKVLIVKLYVPVFCISLVFVSLTITFCLLNCIIEKIQATEGPIYFPRRPRSSTDFMLGFRSSKIALIAA